MRAVRYHEHGDPEVLRVDEVERPAPAADEVLIEVRAAGVNPVDTYFRSGAYSPSGGHTHDDPGDDTLPRIPGSDAAGVVAEVGADATGFEVGDRVVATGLGRSRPGAYAEYVPAPTDRVASLPDGVAFRAAGALGVVGVTAWRALIDHAGLEPAETCLIHGGSGGVGHVAVQLASTVGARTIATASPAYHDRLRSFGADAVIGYARPDLAEGIIDAGRPDVVLDHRFDEYVGLDVDVAARAARLVAIGNTDPEVRIPHLPDARSKELAVSLMSMSNTPDKAAVLWRLARLMAAGRLSVAVDRAFGLGEAPAAHRAVVGESFLGKLVVEP